MKITILFVLAVILVVFTGCKKESDYSTNHSNRRDEAAYNQQKDYEIQQYNLGVKKELVANRYPCDTISVIETVLRNYPSGTYLLETDKSSLYNIPGKAVLYYQGDTGKKYIFAVIAKSRSGERLIDPSNITGYEQSFIDLDSTKLGTPFLFLVLFECSNENLTNIWEALIPSHGGFNNITLKKWNYTNTDYIELNFHYAEGIGHINYNYFLIDGLQNKPHLLMTYEGIDFKRNIANVNNDKYPDYLESLFYNLPNRIYSPDAVPFVWNEKLQLYVNTRNSKQTRPY